MEDTKLEDVVAAQNTTIQQLQEQLADLAARMPARPEPQVQAGGLFPRSVYRKGGKKGQIDHPGVEIKTVGSQAECDAAVKDGWQVDPLAPDYGDAAPEPEPVKKGKK